MSEIQKCPNLVRGWGRGQHFSKMSEIQKCPKCPNPNWDIVPNFLVFLF